MSFSYWQSTGEKTLLQSDFVVVGGGIAGFSAAYWLEKKYPKASIVLVEKNKMGAGASGRNAGFITCGSAEHFSRLVKDFGSEKALQIWQYSEMNRELLRSEIIKDNADRVLFRSTGSCTVAPSDEDFSRYIGLADSMAKVGIDVELINEARMKNEYAVKGFKGGIEYKHDGVVHPVLLLKEIRSHLKKTRVIEDQEVFKTSGEGPISVESQNYILKADKVLVALNGYVGLLWPEWEKLVRPQRGQIIVTEPLPNKVKGPCYLTKHLCYFRQMPTGELLVGGFRNLDLDNENTYLDRVSQTIQNALIEFTKNFFDFTSALKIKNQWSGMMGFTQDGQMIIGEIPTKKNHFVMAGCSGHGMGLSFHAAKTLVDCVAGVETPKHLSINRTF